MRYGLITQATIDQANATKTRTNVDSGPGKHGLWNEQSHRLRLPAWLQSRAVKTLNR